ncbi:hypothetical protein Trydic_g1511 [Trypoxylus dichotomus]
MEAPNDRVIWLVVRRPSQRALLHVNVAGFNERAGGVSVASFAVICLTLSLVRPSTAWIIDGQIRNDRAVHLSQSTTAKEVRSWKHPRGGRNEKFLVLHSSSRANDLGNAFTLPGLFSLSLPFL